MKKILTLFFVFCGISTAFAEQLNRVEISLGAHFPLGKYREPDGGLKLNYYAAGVTSGLSYTRFITNNFGFGAFLDDFYITTPKKNLGNREVRFQSSTNVLGLLATAQTEVAENWRVVGTLKTGPAFSDFGWLYSAAGQRDYEVKDGSTSWMLGAEAGFRYTTSEHFDIGLSAKYSYLKQKTEDDNRKKFSLDLGGPSLVAALGYRW